MPQVTENRRNNRTCNSIEDSSRQCSHRRPLFSHRTSARGLKNRALSLGGRRHVVHRLEMEKPIRRPIIIPDYG